MSTACNRLTSQLILANAFRRSIPFEKMTSSRPRHFYSNYAEPKNAHPQQLVQQPSSQNHAIPTHQRHFFSWNSRRNSSHHRPDHPPSSTSSKERDHYLVDVQQPPTTPSGLFGKLKQLTKLYGSAALVVYGLIGAVDFGLAFLTIYFVGEDHVRRAEDWLLDQLNWRRVLSVAQTPESSAAANPNQSENDHTNMLWATAVVAYTIHKTVLLPVRLGLTAWITPPIVRALRKRGWKLGRNLE